MTILLRNGHSRSKCGELQIPFPLNRRGFQPRRFYWCNLNRSANAEVDYVIERGMKVTPLEVKSGTRGSMKSLRYLMELKGITSAVRSSLENFARLDGVEIVPLYALSNLIDRR